MTDIQKPIKRSRLRHLIGKEYYILKRMLRWYFGGTKWANQRHQEAFSCEVIHHRSLILRPLKDVEMYLQHNKKTNLKLAVGKINGIVIHPGEVFSFWKLVGRPTKAKGYLEGLVLSQGKIDKDTGGGLCQLGNLIFWMAAHSELTITERYRHGYDVFPDVNRKVPFGSGATLSYNYIDLQIKNETNKAFGLHFWLDETHLHGKISCDKSTKSYRIEERNHVMKQQYWGGYSRHNQIYKIDTESNNEELLVENHAIMMYEPFLQQ